MNVLSLFSGVGGLDLGLERTGMTVVGQVEIDPFCRRVLAKHWPEVPRHDDVRTAVEWWRSEPRPRVDLVCGGFPCQPVSLAGLQRAQKDPRWLWPALAAVVRDLRPRWVLLENVPGLLGRGMGDVLGDLAACGYDAEWDCVPAAAVGAPHLRDRVFVVAYAQGCRGPDEPPSDQRESILAEPGPGHRVVSRHPAARVGKSRRGAGFVAATVADPTRSGRRQGRPGRPVGGGTDRSAISPPRLGWARSDAAREGRNTWWPWASGKAASGEQDQDRTESSGRTWWAVEPTVGRVAYGVPSRVDRLRALGNAVVPQVAEHIGRLILNAESCAEVAS